MSKALKEEDEYESDVVGRCEVFFFIGRLSTDDLLVYLYWLGSQSLAEMIEFKFSTYLMPSGLIWIINYSY